MLACWQRRFDEGFSDKRISRLEHMKEHFTPLKAQRHEHYATIHRLRFEEAIAAENGSAREAREQAEAELAQLQTEIAPLEAEINQLTRQFWVTKGQVAANNYDLSASRYRQSEREEPYLEEPEVTIKRIDSLDRESLRLLQELLAEMPCNE